MKDLSLAPGIGTDAQFLNGNIVDGTTIINEFVHQDIIQFFQKMMSLAAKTPNGKFDNETNGYQLIDALIGINNKQQNNVRSLTLPFNFVHEGIINSNIVLPFPAGVVAEYITFNVSYVHIANLTGTTYFNNFLIDIMETPGTTMLNGLTLQLNETNITIVGTDGSKRRNVAIAGTLYILNKGI